MGVQQSRGWVHYAIHRPEPHIMLYRCEPRAKAGADQGGARLTPPPLARRRTLNYQPPPVLGDSAAANKA